MIECVPNISEGRSAPKIEAIVGALRASPARLIDVHVDGDHHRSVFTLVGDRRAVSEAAVLLARECVARIDLTTHRGVHPRMGALDVVPFVPLAGSSIDECVDVACEVGRRIASELMIPVYLYGEAAKRPERRRLSRVRGRGFEALPERMAGEGFLPDYGPPRVHPTAGACAVGARRPLVAFNVDLDTEDVSVAQRIASAIRETGGGLPGVQALGLALASRRCVQVSMNLTDVEAVSVPAAFRCVEEWARRSGVRVRASEIVGLAPRIAVQRARAEDLLLEDDLASHILEDRLERT